MPVLRAFGLASVAILVVVGSASGQHAYTPEEVADGGRIFQSVCAGCHGIEGDAISGANLMTGTFRRSNDDEGLIEIIRLGVDGTGMPPNEVSAEQAGLIVGYLRSMSGTVSFADASAGGDATRGRGLFESRGCMNCHRVEGEGGRRGPDLSRVGAIPGGRGRGFVPPTAEDIRNRLATSIVDPNAEVAASNRTFRVVPVGGTAVAGRLLNNDTHAVSILVDGERVESFVFADLAESGIVDSPMPSFRERLSTEELADLVSYLATLTGQ
jgi:putative heme-binding domain-containing protein